MKKIVAIVFLFCCFACNDGEFDVPAFEFTETINECGGLLYILSQDSREALILTIDDESFPENAGETTKNISGSISLNYRIFDDGISQNYFCQDIPPASPQVIKELEASEGSVVILTNVELDDNQNIIGYNYDISFSNLLFKDGEDRIFFETFVFGNYKLN